MSQMDETPRESVLARYADHLEGSDSGLFCTLSANPLSEQAGKALAKTAESLGYGPRGATAISIAGAGEDREDALDAADLFELIEGLDPLCVIATDAPSVNLLSQAYRSPLKPLAANRAGGRPVRAFEDLDALMGDPSSKQLAWAQLRTLPSLR